MIRGPGHIFISAGKEYSYENTTHGSIIRTYAVPNGTQQNQYYYWDLLDQKNVLVDANGGAANNSNNGDYNSLAQLNDSTYVLAYSGTSNHGYIVTFNVNMGGEITVLKQIRHDASLGQHNSLVSVNDKTVALAYTNSDGGYIKTFAIPSDGSLITEVKSVKLTETEANGASYFSFVKLNEAIYALAYAGKGIDGYISTVKIENDGGTVEVLKTIEHDENQNSHNSLIQIRPNTVMLACSGVGDDGYIKTFIIPTDGSDITPEISLEHNPQRGIYNNILQIDSDTYLLTYYQENGHGVYRTFTSEWIASEVDPEISTLKLLDDNSKIEVTYNEPVYTATGATTALTAADFKFSLSGGTAKLASPTPTSFSQSSNTYTLGISLTGTPDGREILTVTPAAADAIYDADNNAASVDHLRNSVNLHDKTAPTIISAINYQNEYIDVTFSDPVFGQPYPRSNLGTGDFTLSITGGTATLSSAAPSVVTSGADMYGNQPRGSKVRLKILDRITGVPNGEEKIAVLPANGSICTVMLFPPLKQGILHP